MYPSDRQRLAEQLQPLWLKLQLHASDGNKLALVDGLIDRTYSPLTHRSRPGSSAIVRASCQESTMPPGASTGNTDEHGHTLRREWKKEKIKGKEKKEKEIKINDVAAT
jgi:hypothetical protein